MKTGSKPKASLLVSQLLTKRRTAHLFMHEKQEFVWGLDLKAGLRAVNAHFIQLPEHVRERGVMSFAHASPNGNIVADLWDKHLRPTEVNQPRESNPERDAQLIKCFKEFSRATDAPA